MHKSSYDKMLTFRNTYLSERESHPLLIMDLGSQDVNGSYRPCFDRPAWTYMGLDMVPGKNVDIVLDNPYDWRAVKTGSVDVVVSGQAFEHIEFFWVTMLEIARILKTGGLVCIIAPSAGFEHKYPLDCWRFYPDGFRALARYAGLTVLDSFAQFETDDLYKDDSNFWHDCVLVAKKPSLPFKTALKLRVRGFLNRLLLQPADYSSGSI